jgi:hypothetical protein
MDSENTKTRVEKEAGVLTRVSPLSKCLAMFLFIFLPFIGGWIGYTYAPDKIVEIEKLTTTKTTWDGPAPTETEALVFTPVAIKDWPDEFEQGIFSHKNELYKFRYGYDSDRWVALERIHNLEPLPSGEEFNFTYVGINYMKNDNHVVYLGGDGDNPGYGADPLSFTTLDTESGHVFGIDDRNIYEGRTHLKGVDVQTMTFIQDSAYSLPIVHDDDTYWFPVGGCNDGHGYYREGSKEELLTYDFPC